MKIRNIFIIIARKLYSTHMKSLFFPFLVVFLDVRIELVQAFSKEEKKSEFGIHVITEQISRSCYRRDRMFSLLSLLQRLFIIQ